MFSVPSDATVKITKKDGSELNTYGFKLSMIAQNNQAPGKFVKAVPPKNPFDDGKCIYKTDGKLVVLSVRLV